MVFWATMLSFIVGIFLALIYPRNDKHLLENVPLAEAYVASFVAQHQAARNYANAISLALPYMNTIVGNDVGGTTAPSGDATALTPTTQLVHVFKEDFNENFVPLISPTEGKMAPSYNLFPGPDDGYVSTVICLDKVDDKDGDKWDDSTAEYGDVISCKTKQNTFKYVLTYGLLYPSDEEETRVAFRDKRLLWEKALVKRTKNTYDCGFIETGGYTSDGKPHVMSLNAQGRRIPEKIYNLYSDYITEYNETNGVLFCITPVKTPYITDGLVYHFDAPVNQISTASEITHREEKSGWTNIVTTIDTNFESQTGEIGSWHPDNLIPLGLRNTHHFSLDIENKNVLGSFTLSFVLKFMPPLGLDSSEMPLFGSTQPNVYPRMVGTYKNKNLEIKLIKDEWFQYGSFSHYIQNTVVAISYVVTPKVHMLYVNGELVKNNIYNNNLWFTALGANTITIGADNSLPSTKLSADLYNVKLYNRALSEEEIQYNLKTDRNRFGF